MMNFKRLTFFIYILVFLLGAVSHQFYFLTIHTSQKQTHDTNISQNPSCLQNKHDPHWDITENSNDETSITQCVSDIVKFTLGDRQLNVGREVIAMTPTKLPYVMPLEKSEDTNNLSIESHSSDNNHLEINIEDLETENLPLEPQYAQHFTLDETTLPPGMQEKLQRRKTIIHAFLEEKEYSMWGEEIAEKIESFIYNTEQANAIEISSINCREKTCIVLVNENESGAMQTFNHALYSHLQNSGIDTYSSIAISPKDGHTSYSLVIRR